MGGSMGSLASMHGSMHGGGSMHGSTHGGVGGLSAMFTGGLDIGGGDGGGGGVSGGGAPPQSAYEAPVRGGTAFGGSSLGGRGASYGNVTSLAPGAVSPVGSLERDGGIWSMRAPVPPRSRGSSESLNVGSVGSDVVSLPKTAGGLGGGSTSLFGGAGGGDPGPGASPSAWDRAETPGISAEAAAAMLDSLEEELDASEMKRRRDDDPCGVTAYNLPPEADELFLYKTFAPHGAVLGAATTPGTSAGTVRFAKRADAVAATRAVELCVKGVRVVVDDA